jgi:hypothetical protein
MRINQVRVFSKHLRWAGRALFELGGMTERSAHCAFLTGRETFCLAVMSWIGSVKGTGLERGGAVS